MRKMLESIQGNILYSLLLILGSALFGGVLTLIAFGFTRARNLAKNLRRFVFIYPMDDEDMHLVKDILTKNKINVRTTGTFEGSEKDAVWVIRYKEGMDLFNLIGKRKNTIPVVIYYPFRDGKIPDNISAEINKDYPYCEIVNSPMRLMNAVYSDLSLAFV